MIIANIAKMIWKLMESCWIDAGRKMTVHQSSVLLIKHEMLWKWTMREEEGHRKEIGTGKGGRMGGQSGVPVSGGLCPEEGLLSWVRVGWAAGAGAGTGGGDKKFNRG